MTEPTDSFLNLSLGRYEIRERIGTGGMARVFKGYDKNLDRFVAIKVLHDHYSYEPTFKERFEREAKLIAALNHPNVVQVYDFDSMIRNGSQYYYMVMSYIQGVTLRDIIQEHCEKETHIDHEYVLRIMLDMTSALGYAHQQGMIHRDVKPANILIHESGKAVLTDFGIARFAENSNLTQEGLTVGTPTYMSPEQATGGTLDARTDLYSLGVILYEMLAGTTPFSDDGSLSVLIKHIQEDIPRLSMHEYVDNIYLDQVIYKALAKLPDDRYHNADEFAQDIKQAFAGKTPEGAKAFIAPKSATKIINFANSTSDDDKTFVISTDPQQNTASPQTSKRHYSPLIILTFGLFVIVMLLVIGMLSDDDPTNNNNAVPPTENNIESMTGNDTESMTGNLYFTTNFLDEFGDYWAVGELDVISRTITEDGIYQIRSEQGNRAFATIFEVDANYDNHIVSMTGTLDDESSNTSGYGIIFRYIDDDNYNVFAVDGLGRFSIWVRVDGQWRELREADETWTSHPAINARGSSNILTIRIENNEFIGMVNDEIVITISDNTIVSGNVGIYMATPASGVANISVSSYSVTEISSESVESMTGNEPELTAETTNDN